VYASSFGVALMSSSAIFMDAREGPRN